jgi:hypothetical protein
MTTIRSGLAIASLTALALGAASPAVAAPPTPEASSETAATSTAAAVASPHLSRIETAGTGNVVVMGLAPGASMVHLDVDGGSAGDTGIPVQGGRFSSLVDVAHLGKAAKLTAYRQGPDGGRSTPVDIVLELGVAEGEDEAPGKPVVHAVSSYDDEHLVIEGTVAHAPALFHKTEVWAGNQGLNFDFTAENGAFSIEVPVARAGETLDVQAFYGSHRSETTPVELVATETNTAPDAHPLEVASPAAGEVVTTSEATFAGTGIPNSQIVVTRDEKTNRASSTLCETHVTSLGDWSCTSPALPFGSYETTVTETPTWASAPKQETSTAFTVASQPLPGERPVTPMLSSVGLDNTGQLKVQVIADNASELRMTVDEEDVTFPRGRHGRFVFHVDPALMGKTAVFTGIRGDARSTPLEAPLSLLEAAAGAPLQAPRVHQVLDRDDSFLIYATTSFFPGEFAVPEVIAKVDGVFVGASGAVYNGATFLHIDAEHAGDEVELFTVRGDGKLSPVTTLTLEASGPNTAPEVFPLDVVSPAEGETITADTRILRGEGIPGSRIVVAADETRSTPLGGTSVLADGTWTLEVDEPLTAGDHTMTVTETPFWTTLSPLTSKRSFTVTDGSDGGESDERAITVTAPVDGSTFAGGSVVTFTGTATPDAAIAVHLGYGLAPVTGTADSDGDWTVSRWLGNAPYTATITQSNDGEQIGDRHTGPSISPATTAPIEVTAPVDGSTFTAGSVVTFTGTATPDAAIAVHLGYGLAPVTGTANAAGEWTVSRWLGNAPYTATVVQSKDGKQIGDRHTGPSISPATTAPIEVTAPVDGSTFTAGSVVTFTGTATPDAAIAVHLGYGLAPVTGTADSDGDWTVSRWLGNAPYTATVVQSKDGKQLGTAHTGPRITPAG